MAGSSRASMVFEGGVEPRVNFFRRGAAGTEEETQTSEEEEDNMERYSTQKYTRAKLRLRLNQNVSPMYGVSREDVGSSFITKFPQKNNSSFAL
ncbi:hypothetical protein EYF80_055160 [Liparis tanakae]|uniref:Uncharacterized protein n=1 Tax=Liparis tanakae TaxID=230148 RepID=A0A4Z2F0D9_9TELE|nr:hypothetical protein EYF80_055160 [Liparis tanakae]